MKWNRIPVCFAGFFLSHTQHNQHWTISACLCLPLHITKTPNWMAMQYVFNFGYVRYGNTRSRNNIQLSCSCCIPKLPVGLLATRLSATDATHHQTLHASCWWSLWWGMLICLPLEVPDKFVTNLMSLWPIQTSIIITTSIVSKLAANPKRVSNPCNVLCISKYFPQF